MTTGLAGTLATVALQLPELPVLILATQLVCFSSACSPYERSRFLVTNSADKVYKLL